MSYSLFDSHCHLENERFAEDVDDVLLRMDEQHVDRALLAGSDMETSEKIVTLAQSSPNLYGAVGVHPHEAKGMVDGDMSLLADWLTLSHIVAVGEIGLDYFYDYSPRDVQKEVFLKQLRLAYDMEAPAVFHVRDAHGDMLDLLRAHRSELPQGVLHCYSGSVESAREYLDMGFYLSFAGPITFKNAAHLLDVVKFCPLDRLMVETDSPYLAPEPHRGERNEPTYVALVAQKAAELKEMTMDDLVAAATANTERLFKIER